MISKETFVNTMTRLELLDDHMSDVDTALRALSPDFCGFYIPEVVQIVLDLLKDAFDDECDWIGYCVCEKDFLHSFKPDDVLDKEGNPVDLTSWGKLYDFLIENMEEQG